MNYAVFAQAAAAPATQNTQAAAPQGDGAAPAAGASSLFGGPMIPLLLIFVVFMLFMSRSNKKQAARRQEALNKIMKGDRVVTNAGIFGVISEVKADTFMLEVAPKVVIEINKAGVSAAIPQDDAAKTDKAADNKDEKKDK
ncbi:MAG: preprotein translocase subunit YajC [Victivallaceae bacterium]|nr:preprotein translocase subunit YajC [Victivallaceae bacterium]